MSKATSEARSEMIKRELDRIEKDLSHAVTYRMLYFRAYTILTLRIQDTMIGVTDLAGLHQTYGLLSEVMPKHAQRIKTITAVSSPSSPEPRWSELER